jgi:hypothetical protein
MSKKVYYKIVRDNLTSAIVWESNIVTQYKIGEFISSPIPETPLCVFDDLGKAKDFMEWESTISKFSHRLFTCKIKTKLKSPWIPNYLSINEILEKMKLKKRFLCNNLVRVRLPSGTVCCKQVKLLEEVK